MAADAPSGRGVDSGTSDAQSKDHGPGPDPVSVSEQATAAYLPGDISPGSAATAISAPSSTDLAALEPPRGDDELGWLAHYRVKRMLGAGGMGQVFLAEDTQLLRPVALKVIRPELAAQPEAAARFTREARAAAAIKHDNVVTIYHVGEARQVAYIAMEYLLGMSLEQWLNKGKAVSIDQVLRIGREVASGLAAAHALGLVHRDIKPANIWLEAPRGRVKILDFGQARAEREDVQITHAGTIIGTPAYMSPEQAAGERVDASSDLFSLGCALYRLCTGERPFQGTTILAVLHALVNQTPPRPRERNPSVPPALDELIMRLLEKAPARRPSSAQTVAHKLRSIERGLVEERRPSEVLPAPDLAAVFADLEPTQPATLPLPRAQTRPASSHQPAFPARWVVLPALALMAAALATWAARSFQQLTAKGQLTAHTTTPASTQPEPAFSSSIASASEPTVADVAPVPGPMPAEPAPSPRVTRSPPAATDPRPTITLVEVPSDEAEGATRSNPAESLPLASGSATFIDPDADCGYEVDEESRAATIRVPGRPHVLSAELGRLNAPRLLWPLRGDFVASVRVAGTNSPAGPTTMKEFAPYHGAGLLLWQGPGDYLRLEIAREVVRGRTRSYINYEYRRAGRLAHSRGETLSEPANFVRLERKGNQVVAAFSADADQWVPDLPLDVGLDSRLQIGLVAINTASNALHARFDEFRVINTNPDPFTAVSVEVRPAKSAFRPSEPVALEVAIVNRSQTPLTIAGERDLAQRYRLVLTDTADKSLARSPHPIEPSASGRDRLLTLIPPGGSLADSIFVDHFRSAWPPGDYLIRIEVPIAPDDRAPKTTSLALTAKPAAIRIEP